MYGRGVRPPSLMLSENAEKARMDKSVTLIDAIRAEKATNDNGKGKGVVKPKAKNTTKTCTPPEN